MKSSYGAQFADPASYSANEANRRRVLPKNGIGDTESIMIPLRDKLAAKGVQFSTGYRATGFILDEAGKVCGVRFFTGKKEQSGVADVHARAVVVATGGFASNQSLVREYLSAWERIGCYTAASMGEGHKLCQALGAQLSDMSVTPSVTSDLPPAAAWSMFARTIVVDAQGNRFANEDYMRNLCAACFTQERGYFWTIFDSGISESGQARSAAQVTSKNASRLVGPCDTVAQLASGMGVSEDVLGKTVDRILRHGGGRQGLGFRPQAVPGEPEAAVLRAQAVPRALPHARRRGGGRRRAPARRQRQGHRGRVLLRRRCAGRRREPRPPTEPSASSPAKP